MHADTLYLDGTHIRSKAGIMFRHSTQTALLAVAFCKKVNLRLCLVLEEECGGATNDAARDIEMLNKQLSGGFLIPRDVFTCVSTQSRTALPDEVQNCRLPVIFMPSQTYVICGLCHVLRRIIKLASSEHNPELIKLLGLKQCCLKASSEVSSRTYLCEAYAPKLIDEWLLLLSSPAECNNLPDVIDSAEKLLNAPVKMHNMDKHQRKILKRLSEMNETLSEPKRPKVNEHLKKQVVKTQDLPPLKHVFMEGVEFMISDLAILPAVDVFVKIREAKQPGLNASIPLLLQWYKRTANLSAVAAAVEACGVKLLDFGDNSQEETTMKIKEKSFVLELGKEQTAESARRRTGTQKTLRRDLLATVEHYENRVQVHFMQFPRDSTRIEWSALPPSVHPVQGELTAPRATRKCQQIENIVCAVKSICVDGDVIVDFCCGGGHVGIVLAHLLPRCKIILIDNKEESLDRARARASDLALRNIAIYQCNLEHFSGAFKIGAALHACGVASDMVMRECTQRNASFVISPCCYGRIQNTSNVSYPQSDHFRNVSCGFEDIHLLGRGGDQTSWNFESVKSKQGKRCMGLVDMDRIAFARSRGYRCQLLSLNPPTCSPKNNLIVGVAPDNARQIADVEPCVF